MISRDEVIFGYRLILGRRPESEAAIEHHRQHADLMAFRHALLQSDEFRQSLDTAAADDEDASVGPQDFEHTRIVFLHIPKTAGSSLDSMLRSAFPNLAPCPERFNRLGGMRAAQLARYGLFSGHFDLANCRLIPGRRRMVTLLRDPTERLVSIYNFLRAHKADVVERNDWGMARLAATLDIEQFYGHPRVRRHPQIDNGMARALSGSLRPAIWPKLPPEEAESAPLCFRRALDGLESLDAFGLKERFEQSVRHIMAVLGAPPPASISRKMAFSELSRESSNYRSVMPATCSPALREVVASLVDVDAELYGEARSLLDRRLAAAAAS